MNPAMSSWVALRQRVQFQAGQNVLVLGATGNAGQMAKLFGADQIIAAGRSAECLAGLPARHSASFSPRSPRNALRDWLSGVSQSSSVRGSDLG